MWFKMKKRTWYGTALALLFPPVFTWLNPQLQCCDWSCPFWSDQLKFSILSIPARRRTGGGLRHHQSKSPYVKTYSRSYFLRTGSLEPPTHRSKHHSVCFWTICLQIQVLQVRSDTSGRTEAHNSSFGEMFLLPGCAEQHPCRGARTVLPFFPIPAVPRARYPSVWGWAQAHLSSFSKFSQQKWNSAF